MSLDSDLVGRGRALQCVVIALIEGGDAHLDNFAVLNVDGVSELEVGLNLFMSILGRQPGLGEKFALRLEPLPSVNSGEGGYG